MTFSHDPVVPPSTPNLTFDSPVITSANFQESNGESEILITTTVPVLASFSNNGRTITIEPPASAATAIPISPSGTVSPVMPPPGIPPVIPPSAARPNTMHYFAVVDASHGGDERGAALTEQMAEKDVTLVFARLLRQELNGRGMPTLLVRDADTTLTTDQRATITNTAAPAIYVCVHASSQGTGVRVYTALAMPGGGNAGPFLDWDTAQNPVASLSDAAATSVAAALHSKQVSVRTLTVPLRPLNNITTAAVAIEIAPPGSDISRLNSTIYQQAIAVAVAAGVADVREKLQAVRK